MKTNRKITIVGGGPSGLFCAYLLLKSGHAIDLYDSSSGLGKKFLIAGNGGLNLTHSEELTSFTTRYGKNEYLFKSLINDFSPSDLRQWCLDLGVETFIGSSGRIFPREMSAGKVLVNWTRELKSHDSFNLFLKHRLVGLDSDKRLIFENEGKEVSVMGDTIIFALGGASWKKTGSDGIWKSTVESIGVRVDEFLPMNCGLERAWSEYFKENNNHTFLKHVEVSFKERKSKGDITLTSYGLEGGAIYALSHFVRDEVLKNGKASISLDLRPALSTEAIKRKLGTRPKKMSLSNHLRKALNFDSYTFTLLKELLEAEDFNDSNLLAKKIKNLEIEVNGFRPLDEAISTSGGVCFSQLSEGMELKAIPGLYFCGEMLDFDAPTGGYLLQGCFSTAWRVAEAIKNTDFA